MVSLIMLSDYFELFLELLQPEHVLFFGSVRFAVLLNEVNESCLFYSESLSQKELATIVNVLVT